MGETAAHRPNFFVIGAPKAGTTSLYEYLQEHPDIYMSPVKEPGYFSPDVHVRLATRSRYEYPRDEARYLELFAAAAGEPRLGEASTTYLMSQQAPALIGAFSPDARVIVMLRNPIDLVHSLHNERVSNGIEPLTDFATALAADDDRRQGMRLPEGLAGYGVAYRDNAYLGGQLARWLEELGRDAVHVIVFEDFAADPRRELRGVLEFLGVDADFEPSSFAVHNVSHRKRRGLVQLIVSNRVTRFASRRLLPAVLGEARALRLVGRFRRSRIVRQEQARQPMPPDTRRQLEADFRDDVEHLGRLIDRDLAGLWFGA